MKSRWRSADIGRARGGKRKKTGTRSCGNAFDVHVRPDLRITPREGKGAIKTAENDFSHSPENSGIPPDADHKVNEAFMFPSMERLAALKWR